jgi:sensor domain CHASE-containing protein
MTDLSTLTPHELLDRVENRNRWFKLASVLFGVVLTAGIIILLVIGLHTLQGVNNQLAQQKQLLTSQHRILSQIQDSSNERAQQLSGLQGHIDCIVSLFQQPTHSTLTVSDLENCKLSLQ